MTRGIEMSLAQERPAEALGATRQDRDHFALTSQFATPGSETERRLLGIWENVLDIDGLGVNDDFFDLGGESLAAVSLFTEIAQAFGRKPPLSSLLEHPTVRQLAGLLDQLDGRPDENPAVIAQRPLVPIRTEGSRQPLFLVHGGGGNVLFARQLLPFLDPEQPLYGIAARGLVEGEVAHRDLDAMTADYLAGIRRIQPKGPYYLSGFCAGSLVAFEMAQRLRAAGDDVAVVIELDPDFNRTFTPWLYWRDPDKLPIRVLRLFVDLAWQGWLLKQRLLGRRPVADVAAESPDARRRNRAINAGLQAAFKRYRPRKYDGKIAILCSGERMKRLSAPITGWPAIAPNATIVEVAAAHRAFFREALPRLGSAIEALLRSTQAPGRISGERANSAAE
jgi:thioesterase domain-containing protein/acyl carrier protein